MVNIKELLKMSKQADYFDKKGNYKAADKIAKKIENDALKIIRMKKLSQYNPVYQYSNLPKGVTTEGSNVPYLQSHYNHPFYQHGVPFAESEYNPESSRSIYNRFKDLSDEGVSQYTHSISHRGPKRYPYEALKARQRELQEHLKRALAAGDRRQAAEVSYELNRLYTQDKSLSPAIIKIKSIASEIDRIDYYIHKIREENPQGISPENANKINELQQYKHKLSMDAAVVRREAGLPQVYDAASGMA